MPTKTINHIADTFKFLSDPTRLKILQLLLNQQNEICVKEIADAVDSSPSATSHQLSKLEARGIVSATRYGQTMCYELENNHLVDEITKALSIFDK